MYVFTDDKKIFNIIKNKKERHKTTSAWFWLHRRLYLNYLLKCFSQCTPCVSIWSWFTDMHIYTFPGEIPKGICHSIVITCLEIRLKLFYAFLFYFWWCWRSFYHL
jgi:hypothetical protein